MVLLEPRAAGSAPIRPTLTIANANLTVYEQNELAILRLELDRPVVGDSVSVFWRTLPEPGLNAATARNVVGDPPEFGYCKDEIGDVPGSYDPGAFTGRHWDYQARSGEVLIQAGESAETIEVPIYDDCLYETSERFRIQLYGENVADIILDSRDAVVTIISDDPFPILKFTETELTIAEDADVDVTVPLSVGLFNEDDQQIISGVDVGGLVSVRAGAGTASQSANGACTVGDFALSNGRFNITALTADPVAAPQLEVRKDIVYEPGGETLTLAIGSQVNAALPGADDGREMVVTVNDGNFKPNLLLVDTDGDLDDTDDIVGDREVTRLEDLELTLAVQLVDGTGDEVISGVPWEFTYAVDPPSADHVAVAGTDFVAPPTDPQPVAGCATVPSFVRRIPRDAGSEPDKSFVVRVSTPVDDLELDFNPAGDQAGWDSLTVVIRDP